MIKASLRGLLQRKLRLSLAVFAIVLSVAFLAGSMVLSDTLSARFTALFTTVNQNVAVVVQPKDPQAVEPARLTEAQLRTLSEVDGVRVVSPDVSVQGATPFRATDGEPVSADAALGFGVDGNDDPLGLVELRRAAGPPPRTRSRSPRTPPSSPRSSGASSSRCTCRCSTSRARSPWWAWPGTPAAGTAWPARSSSCSSRRSRSGPSTARPGGSAARRSRPSLGSATSS
ncbi:ABC transporter permease [Catellatospora coxensis]